MDRTTTIFAALAAILLGGIALFADSLAYIMCGFFAIALGVWLMATITKPSGRT